MVQTARFPEAARATRRATRLLASIALLLPFLAVPGAGQLSDGVLDPTFGGGIAILPFDLGGFNSDIGTAVVRTPGDRLLLAGSVNPGAGGIQLRHLAAAQLTWSGGLDSAFGGGDGRVNYPWGVTVGEAVAAAVTSQGKIVLAGTVQWSATDWDFLVVRLLADGGLDPGFGGGDGWVSIPFDVNPGGDLFDAASSLFLTAGDEIVVAGTAKRSANDWDFAVAMLTASGAPDPVFGGGAGKVIVPIDAGGYAGIDLALAVFPSRDGAIVLAGVTENGAAGLYDFAIAEIDYGGDLVASFGIGGKVVVSFDLVFQGADWVGDGTVDPRGRILVAGSAEGDFDLSRAAVVCLTPAGALCSDFGSAGKVTFSLSASPHGDEKAVGIASDDLGRLLLAGTAVPNVASNRDVAVARLRPNGTLDPTFAGGSGIRVVDLNHGIGNHDDEAVRLILAAGKPIVVGATEYNGFDDDFFALRLWVSLIHADGFERGTHEDWSGRAP